MFEVFFEVNASTTLLQLGSLCFASAINVLHVSVVRLQNDSPELLDATAAKYYDTNVQINAHAVGDKAIDNFIK